MSEEQEPTIIEAEAARYEVIEEIGAGSFGRTWLVERLEDRARFLYKELDVGAICGWKGLELFQREIATLKSLDHPGIPSFVDEVLDEDRPGFLQSYIEGPTLQQIVDEARSLSSDELEGALRDCLQALDYLHNRQPPVIHRDLSPGNIILAEDRAYLVDFGAVKVSLGDSTTMTSVGTFGYMAPEQILGRVQPASDLYSLGVSFLTLSTHLSASALPQDPESGALEPGPLLNLPSHLSELLIALTRPGVKARPQSAAEALQTLDVQPESPEQAPPEPGNRPAEDYQFKLVHFELPDDKEEPPPDPGPRRLILRALLASVLIIPPLWFGIGHALLQQHDNGEHRKLGGPLSSHAGLCGYISYAMLDDNYCPGRDSPPSALIFSADGANLAVATRRQILTWAVEPAERIGHAELDSLDWQDASCDLLGDQIACLSSRGPRSRLMELDWDGDIAMVHDLASPAAMGTRHFDRQLAATASSARPESWISVQRFIQRPDEGDPRYSLLVFEGKNSEPTVDLALPDHLYHTSNIASSLSADGARLLITGNTYRLSPATPGRLLVYDLHRKSLLLQKQSEETFGASAIRPDGKQAAIVGQDSVAIWDLERGELLRTIAPNPNPIQPHAHQITYSPDGRLLALADDHQLLILDVEKGSQRERFVGHFHTPKALAISPKNNLVAMSSYRPTIQIWQLSK